MEDVANTFALAIRVLTCAIESYESNGQKVPKKLRKQLRDYKQRLKTAKKKGAHHGPSCKRAAAEAGSYAGRTYAFSRVHGIGENAAHSAGGFILGKH